MTCLSNNKTVQIESNGLQYRCVGNVSSNGFTKNEYGAYIGGLFLLCPVT